MCDRVAVMYLGKIVELADSAELYAHPRMPYTGALMSAVPVADPRISAASASCWPATCRRPTNPPPGCRFHTRCWKAQERCRTEEPLLEPKEGGNLAACHFPLTDAEVAERVPTAKVRRPRRRTAAATSRRPRSASRASERPSARPRRPSMPSPRRAAPGVSS